MFFIRVVLLYLTPHLLIECSQWIDVSDMTNNRFINEKYHHSSGSEIEIRITQKSQIEYKPQDPFPNLESCVLDQVSDDHIDEIQDEITKSNIVKCVMQKMKNHKSQKFRNQNSLVDLNSPDLQNEYAVKTLDTHSKVQSSMDRASKTIINRSNQQSPQAKSNEIELQDSRKVNGCLIAKKEISDDLVCFRNLKSLFTRQFNSLQNIIYKMKSNNQKLEIHPYALEFILLTKILEHKDCLSAVDDLDSLIKNFDKLLIHIEPIDYSEKILKASILLGIFLFFYFVYKYSNIKFIIFCCIFMICLCHEYYSLYLEEKAQLLHERRLYEQCKNRSTFTSIWEWIFSGFYSSFSFKKNECEINEFRLYIDPLFKINPLIPLFTLVPKLFTTALIILFENSAIAFKKFSSKLPIMHVYPILIAFLISLFYLGKLISDHFLSIRRLDNKSRESLLEIQSRVNRQAIHNEDRLMLSHVNNRSKIKEKQARYLHTKQIRSIFQRLHPPINMKQHKKSRNARPMNQTVTFESSKLQRSKSLDLITLL